MARTVRQRLAVGLLVAAAAGAGACSPILTDRPYAAGDGTRFELGDELRGEGILLLTAEEGATARLTGGLVNSTGDELDVTLSVGTETIVLSLPAASTVLLGPDHSEDVLIDSLPAAPGSVVDLTFTTSGSGTITVGVPVLDGTLPEYADYIP